MTAKSDCSNSLAVALSQCFPVKLHQLLNTMEEHGQTKVVSWMNEGKAFKIHDWKKFTKEVMPLFFGTNKIKSFQRNLNLWGFTTDKGPVRRGISYHKYFLRGQPGLCLSMKRTKIKGSGVPRRKIEDSQVEEQQDKNSTSSSIATTKNKMENKAISSRRRVEATRPGNGHQERCLEDYLPAESTMSRTAVGDRSAIIQALRQHKTSGTPEPGALQDRCYPAAVTMAPSICSSMMGLGYYTTSSPSSTMPTPGISPYMPYAGSLYLSHLLRPASVENVTGGRNGINQDYVLARECARNEFRTELLLHSTMSTLTQTLERRILLLSAMSNTGNR